MARLGVGLRHRPSPGFAKSQASAACLRGHLRPRTRPFCAGSPQRPSAERQFLTRSAAKLLKAFQSLPTFEIRPVRVVPCSRSPRGKGGEKTRRPGTPKLPQAPWGRSPSFPARPSASRTALRHAPILQPGSPEARRACLSGGMRLVITQHATRSENTEGRKRSKKCYLGNHRRLQASWWAGRGGRCPPAAGTLLDYAYS